MYQIKAAGDYEIEILAVPFGDSFNRDSDGEYFSAETKLHLDKFPSPPLVYFHGFDDPNRQSPEPVYIGRTTGYEVRKDGVWFRGVLDKANEYAKRVWEAVQNRTARASSGSVTHLVRKTADGLIKEWPLAEISVFDTADGRQPANRHAVALPVMKSLYTQAGIDWPADIEPERETVAKGAGRTPVQSADVEPGADNDTSSRGLEMEPNDLQAMIDEVVASRVNEATDKAVKSALDERDAAEEAERKRQAEMKAAIEEATKKVAEAKDAEIEELRKAKEEAETKAAEGRRLPGGDGAPYVAQFNNLRKYEDLEDPLDLAVLIGVLDGAAKSGKGRGPSENAMKALAVRIAESDEPEHRAAKSAMKAAGMSMKANELNRSTYANFGDEWVGVTYSTQLWDKIRLATPVVGRIPTVTVPQGSESIVIPLQSNSPTFYKVAQASAQDSNPGRVTPTFTTSKLGTANQTLTVNKLGAAVNFSGELVEDSLIPWVSELRRDLTAEAAEVLEHIVIDGDTETGANTNINDIAGTPAGSEAFMLFNGFRKLALVTNTANSRDAGTLAVTDYLETVKLLGLAGKNAVDKRAVSLITDLHTHWKSLELAEVKTRDVFVAPTIENGMLMNLYGYEIIPSANMHRANQDATYGLKANTAGKVDLDTASNNTTGSILAVRWDQWRFGYKRRMTFEVERDAISDSTAIVVHMRVGMINRDNDASAISYNVGL